MATSTIHESGAGPPATSASTNDMSSIKARARFAGLLYLVMSITAVFGYMYGPSTFIVSGDAAATARKITEGALMYRITVLTSFVSQILFIFLVLSLYNLFKDVDRRLARMLVVLVCVAVAAEMVTIADRIAPLMFLSGADFLSVFTKPQLEALALGHLRLGSNLGQLLTGFWGLWLFPFGILTIKSGFFPKILGILLFVSGFAYVATCLTFIVYPAHLHAMSQIMTPLYFGELAIVLWLPIMGAKVPQVEARLST
jgi:hypothetical protein